MNRCCGMNYLMCRSSYGMHHGTMGSLDCNFEIFSFQTYFAYTAALDKFDQTFNVFEVHRFYAGLWLRLCSRSFFLLHVWWLSTHSPISGGWDRTWKFKPTLNSKKRQKYLSKKVIKLVAVLMIYLKMIIQNAEMGVKNWVLSIRYKVLGRVSRKIQWECRSSPSLVPRPPSL